MRPPAPQPAAPRQAKRRRRAAAVVALGACVAVVGCGGGGGRNAFDEISRLPTVEKLEEVEIGKFIVPVPVVLTDDADEITSEHLLQLNFRLVAIVDPDHVARVKWMRERHAGKIRDEIIRVCRNTAADDLLESEWATLKAHLLDATQPLLGGSFVRRLATPHKVIEPL